MFCPRHPYDSSRPRSIENCRECRGFPGFDRTISGYVAEGLRGEDAGRSREPARTTRPPRSHVMPMPRYRKVGLTCRRAQVHALARHANAEDPNMREHDLAHTTAALTIFVALAGEAIAASAGGRDWPTYGHDPHHTFNGRTTLDSTSVVTLAQAWFFTTGDAVTANPIVVNGTLYVGSREGNFYAVDAVTGKERWHFTIDAQLAIHPQPGNRQPGDLTSDGGVITSSAYFLPASGARPDLVIFGGGYTLYALRAADGTLFWKHAYTGRPELPPDPDNDGTRIFSSPVVVGSKVLVSTT